MAMPLFPTSIAAQADAGSVPAVLLALGMRRRAPHSSGMEPLQMQTNEKHDSGTSSVAKQKKSVRNGAVHAWAQNHGR
jgi:hypothetical protein